MVFTPIAGLGGRVVVPRAGRATSTRRTSSLSASRGGNGSNGGNGLRRTGGSGEGGDSGKARLALSGASLALSLVAALPAAAAPKKGKMVLPELTHFDLAVRARFLVPGAGPILGADTANLLEQPPPQKHMSSTTALSAGVGYGSALLVKVREAGGCPVPFRSRQE